MVLTLQLHSMFVVRQRALLSLHYISLLTLYLNRQNNILCLKTMLGQLKFCDKQKIVRF